MEDGKKTINGEKRKSKSPEQMKVLSDLSVDCPFEPFRGHCCSEDNFKRQSDIIQCVAVLRGVLINCHYFTCGSIRARQQQGKNVQSCAIWKNQSTSTESRYIHAKDVKSHFYKRGWCR